MLYKIDGKFYVKCAGYYIEVEPTYNNGNIGLKPTNNKIECTSRIKFIEVSIQDLENSFKEKRNKYKNDKHNSKSIIDEEF